MSMKYINKFTFVNAMQCMEAKQRKVNCYLGDSFMREKKELNILVGTKIQQAREAAGLTQEKLSEMMDISPKHLSAIERGVYGISLENLYKLCMLLNESADFILLGKAPSNADNAIAQKIAAVRPECREQVMEGLSVLLELAKKK